MLNSSNKSDSLSQSSPLNEESNKTPPLKDLNE